MPYPSKDVFYLTTLTVQKLRYVFISIFRNWMLQMYYCGRLSENSLTLKVTEQTAFFEKFRVRMY